MVSSSSNTEDELTNYTSLKVYKGNFIIVVVPFPNSESYINSPECATIISLDNNISLMRELIPIINYLNQKGYDIITLNELLDE